MAKIVAANNATEAASFLRDVVEPEGTEAGWRLCRVLTDGDSEFKGAFDDACAELDVRHTRTKPRHVWTNGFVERLQGTILHEPWRIVFCRRRFRRRHQLQTSLDSFLKFYNVQRTARGSDFRVARSDLTAYAIAAMGKRIRRDERTSLTLTTHDRDLILDHTLADGRPREQVETASAAGPDRAMVHLTPDDLNDLLEWIAFAANHAETRQLEKELDALYDRLQRVEDSLDVVEGASPSSPRDIRSSKRREMLNRCVVIAKAKEPFLEWLKGLPDPCDATLERVNREATAYLLPDSEEEPEWERILRRYAGAIFEDQLAAWWLDEADWPARRDLRTFKTWFDMEVHSIVLDLADAPIARVV